MTNRTRHRTEAELKALFEQAVRAIGFYEAQRKVDARFANGGGGFFTGNQLWAFVVFQWRRR
jgi:hypothetical protein